MRSKSRGKFWSLFVLTWIPAHDNAETVRVWMIGSTRRTLAKRRRLSRHWYPKVQYIFNGSSLISVKPELHLRSLDLVARTNERHVVDVSQEYLIRFEAGWRAGWECLGLMRSRYNTAKSKAIISPSWRLQRSRSLARLYRLHLPSAKCRPRQQRSYRHSLDYRSYLHI